MADILRIGGGILLSMIGIMLIDQNRWLSGLACFIGGFLLLMIPRFRR
ncbi:hypothetical protein ACFL0S_00930 [Thermodesulfobacteriota bacterium]|jgi:hypothetical protein